MRVISDTVTATAPVNLVRTAVAGDWVAGDNDMNAVYLSMPGKNKFVPVVQALWLSKSSYRPVLPGVVATTKLASRCYLPSLARLADGGCVLACKFGCKEPYKSGIPMDRLDWGSYLICFNADGSVRWQGRYNAHKGNAQVISDPHVTPNSVVLVASTGIVWTIDTRDGRVTAKSKVPIGNTGEKNTVSIRELPGKPGIVTLSFVGYSKEPAAILRCGIDKGPVAVASKPPYEMGHDDIYCSTAAPRCRPRAIWWAAVLNGELRYNYVGPKATRAKWGIANLPSLGPATRLSRHAAPLFAMAGDTNKTRVGVAYVTGGATIVRPLTGVVDRIVRLSGSWPATEVRQDGVVRVLRFDGARLRMAEVECE